MEDQEKHQGGLRDDDEQSAFHLANVSPKKSGLPFVVWIATPRDSHEEPYVTLSTASTTPPFPSISIHEPIHLLNGDMAETDLAALTGWIEVNRAVLLSYSMGDMDTKDVLGAIRPI
jgi:hypothetical protein